MSTIANTSVRWSRVLLVVLIALVAAELSSRAAIRYRFGESFRSFDPYTLSSYGTYRQNPRYTHPRFRQNSVGFRNDEEFVIEKPEGTFRVMLIGASVLYAGSAITHAGMAERVATDETISAYLKPLLEQLPELAGLEVEVINAGINRQYLRQTLSYYVSELARYDPDLVVVFGSHNDSARIEQVDALSTMFYDRDRPTGEEARVELLANGTSIESLAEKTLRVAVNRSAAAAVTYRAMDRVFQRIAQRLNVSPDAGVNPQDGELAGPEQRERALRYYLAGLNALTTYIETQGSQPVVFWEYLLLLVEDIKPLSPHEQAQVEFLKREVGGFSDEHKRLKFEVRDRVMAFLEARGVPIIDIIDDLETYPDDLFNDYLHYNATGNRWIAEVLARDLRPLIGEIVGSDETYSPPPGTDRKDAPGQE